MEAYLVKIEDVIGKYVFAQDDFFLGKVRSIVLDPKGWKISHLEVEIDKDAGKELFGVKKSFLNNLAISAVIDGERGLSDRGVELQVTKGQLNIYLRPTQ
jgi:sporulation protein YlmC with PRC-barrel domain